MCKMSKKSICYFTANLDMQYVLNAMRNSIAYFCDYSVIYTYVWLVEIVNTDNIYLKIFYCYSFGNKLCGLCTIKCKNIPIFFLRIPIKFGTL